MATVPIADSRSSLADQAAEAAGVLKLLAHEGRLLVLCHLAESGELTAGSLGRMIGLSHSAMSQHLALLREEGLVTTRRDSQTVIYRIADPRVHRLLALLKDLYCPELEPIHATGEDQ